MLARPERFFEDRFGLTSSAMERLWWDLHSAAAWTTADLYLEYRVSEELVLEEGAVKKAARHVEPGRGRASAIGRAHGLRAHRRPCAAESRGGRATGARDRRPVVGVRRSWPSGLAGKPHDLYTLAEPPLAADLGRKVSLLNQIDAAARALDPRVRQVIATIGSEDVVVVIADAVGLDRRRHPAAHPTQRDGHRRGKWPA